MTAGTAAGRLDPVAREKIVAIVSHHRHRRGPLIEILHDVQRTLGFVPESAVPLIAAELNLSRADVHGVLTFYHHFRVTPPGRRVVKLCRAEACQAMGGRALEEHARQRLGIGFGETTPDGDVSLEAADCLGLCACSPAAMIDEEVHGRMTAERLDQLLSEACAKVPP
jgi:formate dehydrogenase subunit gamma